jgi:hypothetical protein
MRAAGSPAPDRAGATAGGGAPAGVAAGATATAEAEEPAEHSPELESRWRDVLGGINQRKRMLGAFLEACRFVGRAGVEVRVAMDDLRRVVVEEQENRALIGEEVRRAFGDECVLRCVTTATTPVREVVASHAPLVDQAIEWFQGEAIERTKRAEMPG